MHRFFVPSGSLRTPGDSTPISLGQPLAHQLHRVLRLRPGDHIVLLDGSGWAWEAELLSVSANLATARPVRRYRPETEPEVEIVLFQALPKGKKIEWVLQKGTEIGVATFAPIITRRSIVPDADRITEGRMDRWRRIIVEAAEQSGRARMPELLPVRRFEEACAEPPEDTLALIPWVAETAASLRDALGAYRRMHDRIERVHLYIGPEGGFEPDEVAHAREMGVVPVSLGPRVLRAETAGIVAPALVLYALGEME